MKFKKAVKMNFMTSHAVSFVRDSLPPVFAPILAGARDRRDPCQHDGLVHA